MKARHATLEERRVIHDGRIFRVEIDKVRLPTGHTVPMEIIRHPGSVVLLPLVSPREIVLIRQYRYSIDRWIWEAPAGTLKPGEAALDAAVRECEEEIGMVPGRVERLGSFFPTPGFCDEEMIFFRCSELVAASLDSTVKKDEDEELEPRVFALDDAREMIARNEIVDLKTAVGLALL